MKRILGIVRKSRFFLRLRCMNPPADLKPLRVLTFSSSSPIIVTYTVAFCRFLEVSTDTTDVNIDNLGSLTSLLIIRLISLLSREFTLSILSYMF